MPHSSVPRSDARAAVFAPLDGAGRAELVEQRLTDAIVSGVLPRRRAPAERVRSSPQLGVALVTAREALEALRDAGS